MQIAIDGPAGAGKSTISKAVAKELGFIYIDTGAMYRTAGLCALRNGINIKENHKAAIELMDNIKIDIKCTLDGQLIFLNGEDVTSKIRTEEVSMAASDIAVIGEVREKLVALQRSIASDHDCIMDGRDIGTCVLKNAECKIFLTASVQKRGERRYKELIEKGVNCSLDDICKDIEKRDKTDSEREVSPLKMADDAVLLDTSELNLEDSIEALKNIILNKKEGMIK